MSNSAIIASCIEFAFAAIASQPESDKTVARFEAAREAAVWFYLLRGQDMPGRIDVTEYLSERIFETFAAS